MLCPRCNTDLGVRLGVDGNEAYRECADCLGQWFAAGQLDASDDSVWSQVERAEYIPATSVGDPIACASCTGASTGYRESAVEHLRWLSAVASPNVVIARCDRCAGIWLEKGMLSGVRALANELDRRLLAEARPRLK